MQWLAHDLRGASLRCAPSQRLLMLALLLVEYDQLAELLMLFEGFLTIFEVAKVVLKE